MVKRFWIVAMLSLNVYGLCASKPSKRESIQQLQKLNQFYGYLSQTYIEELDMQPLVEKAIKSMLDELDPHSTYISPEDMMGVKENIKGKFSGIGVEFAVVNDTVVVVNTIAGAPAQSVGLKANDRIVKVNGKSIVGISHNDTPKYLRGKKGSKVDVMVIRHNNGTAEPIDFTITRDNIPIHTVDAAYLLDPKTGYIKINRFGETTLQEFRDSFYSMPSIENLVLDLRGNGGGLLSQAIELSNFFLPKGSIIVSTEGRAITPHKYKATKDGEFTVGGLIILVDENSASASEIVAGAIQDWDRGIIIGETTFGKGVVQRQFPLLDGSVARITIARYHTPSGRVIQRPYKNGESEEYFSHKTESDSTKSITSSKNNLYKTLRLKRSVYGGGGITPDIKLARDTTSFSQLYSRLIQRGVINEFIIQYLDKNRSNFDLKYRDQNDFITSYQVDDKLVSELIEYAHSKKIFTCNTPLENINTAAIKDEAQDYIKAIIAQKLYSTSAFYQVINNEDTLTFEAIKRVLRRGDDNKKYNFY